MQISIVFVRYFVALTGLKEVQKGLQIKALTWCLGDKVTTEEFDLKFETNELLPA